MFTRASNVWEYSAKTPENAKLLQFKAQMMIVIRGLITSKGWNQVEAAKQLKITQPRVSNLTNGQVSKFSLDALYEFWRSVAITLSLTLLMVFHRLKLKTSLSVLFSLSSSLKAGHSISLFRLAS